MTFMNPEIAIALEQQHRALDTFVTGDPKPLTALYSRGDDATVANPFGPPVRGWTDVERAIERAATNYRDGHATGFDPISCHESADLACIVEIERYTSKIGGAADLAPVALRVTTIFRREGEHWRIVHRHADPTLSAQPAEVVLGR